MLVGQKLGPFLIDRELGSGAMGAVYRGRYEKTGQLVAVKVMAPGLGSTNANAAARFEREAAILKQFNHPNIVRLFGIGKSHGTRYYAMEYIEGESLDRVMSRRARMTWEEVVTLGQELCAALQHAHQQGVIHRDLKPSNLMILKDGTLKLTDFGIAKDMDVTSLTSANCTVGTAAYMSPEQCRGDPDLTHKSDLYSLGVVFYELVTGKKPFEAENAMDMFMQHVQGTFVRPGKRVLDLPVWLDTLICQLLEKKPEHRPLDAGTVHVALGKIQEKVEAQLSAGVDAAQRRVIDRQPGEERPDDTDREMARTLLVGKGKKKRRLKRQKFYEKGWFVAAGLVAMLCALGLTLFLLLGPPSAEKLYAQAKEGMDSSNPEEHEKALEGPIKQYLARYSERQGEQTDQIKTWARKVGVEQCEATIDGFLAKSEKKRSIVTDSAEDKTLATVYKALKDEWDGNLEEATKKWEAIRSAEKEEPWGLTAGVRVAMLQGVNDQDKTWDEIYQGSVGRCKEPELQPLQARAFRAYRAEHLGERYKNPDDADLPLAYQIYEDITKEPQNGDDPPWILKKENQYWYLVAAKKARELKRLLPASQSPKEDRRERVARALDAAQQQPLKRSTAAGGIGLDLLALYGDVPEMRDLMEEAKRVVKEARDYQRGE